MANVTPFQLPLHLNRPRADQPRAGALPLSLTLRYCAPESLPLLLDRPRSNQPSAGALPLPLSRPIGSATGDTLADSEPEPPKRRMDGLMGCMSGGWSDFGAIADCDRIIYDSEPILVCYHPAWSDVSEVVACHRPQFDTLDLLNRCQRSTTSDSVEIMRCHHSEVEETVYESRCQRSKISTTDSHSRCLSGQISATDYQSRCASGAIGSTQTLANCTDLNTSVAIEIMRCLGAHYDDVVPVPCEYYPLPIPEPTRPDNSVCRRRPTSDQLALKLQRRRMRSRDASMLPLTLSCWHDPVINPIPIIRTYIMHNDITCSIDGRVVEILSASVQTDIKSFCWQGSITVSPADFAQIDFDRQKGDEPLIDLNINGTHWKVAVENVSDNRQFISNSYTLSGRSATARLGADYASTKAGLVAAQLYARQIADQAIDMTGYSIVDWDIVDWDIVDWLIPANIYNQTNKTPLAVIAEIAAAAGGFVESHKTEPQLFIKPRWQAPAWEIGTATVDKTIPSTVILSISGQERPAPRFNAVRLHGNSEGKLIYRINEDKSAEAGVQSSPLYTDDQPMIAAGKAILSDSGNHKLETVKLPWADSYNISLADLGDIWAVNEDGGTWRGVVQGVAVSVELDNDAPVITQTVQLDRYKDK